MKISDRLLHENGGYFLKTNSSVLDQTMNLKIKKEKKKNSFFGDSNTAGDGVNNNERYAELLEV